MSTLSQFFGSTGSGQGSSTQQFGVLKVFGSTQSYTIPAEASYVSYAAIGGGGGSKGNDCDGNGGRDGNPGHGAGFSYMEGDISSEGAITACVVVGAGGRYSRCDCFNATHKGGQTSITGISLASICGNGGCAGCDCIVNVACGGGRGCGGMINTNGGNFRSKCPGCGYTQQVCCQYILMGGSGAGGFLGDGGSSGCAGGGSGNGGGGGVRAGGNHYGQGAQGVTCKDTSDSLWVSRGSVFGTLFCGVAFSAIEPSKLFHIPGNMYCTNTYYSMGKQMFGAASSSGHVQCIFEEQRAFNDLPGAGGVSWSGCVSPCQTYTGGGFMAGGGSTRCGCAPASAGCGGGMGGVNGCTHPEYNPGGCYEVCCGGNGVAYIEYFVSSS